LTLEPIRAGKSSTASATERCGAASSTGKEGGRHTPPAIQSIGRQGEGGVERFYWEGIARGAFCKTAKRELIAQILHKTHSESRRWVYLKMFIFNSCFAEKAEFFTNYLMIITDDKSLKL
jgi:hypothetical protein